MLFFSYFKDLVGREVTVELKNNLAIWDTLHSVEHQGCGSRQVSPHGSVVRYVQLPPDGVDIKLLHDAARREARGG